jgi:hypothetical protein
VKLLLLLLPAFSFGQTPDLHITASPLLPSTVQAMFGRHLPKGYSAVSVDICSNRTQSVSVPLGLIRQKYRAQFPMGPTILSNTVASQVILAAQGSAKSALTGRIVLALAGSTAVAVGFSGLPAIWKTGLTDFSLDGPLLWNLFSSVAQPAAFISYSQQALPETIQIAPSSCAASSTQLVEGAVSAVGFDVTLPAEKTTTGAITVTPQADGTIILGTPATTTGANVK